jgi:hypothetical protein
MTDFFITIKLNNSNDIGNLFKNPDWKVIESILFPIEL